MSALFLAASIIVAVIARMGEEEFTTTFVNGARDLLGVALVIGIARGIVVVMDAGKITDTILFWSEGAVRGLSTVAFINVMFVLELILSFFVPSSSGLAVLTMPIMAPLADFSNVGRDLVVTAYQSASGLLNLVNPDLRRGDGRSGDRTRAVQPLASIRDAAGPDPGRDHRRGPEHFGLSSRRVLRPASTKHV